MLKKNFTIISLFVIFFLSIQNVHSIESDVFVQSTVNRASKVLSENISRAEKINELKNIAYSKTKVEYMLETIDPAYVPMKPFYPNRVLIILMGILAGIASSFLYIYLRISISKN